MDVVADHYLVEKLASASPAELVGMLYDKAVLSLKRAKTFLDDGENDLASARIRNAIDIVVELRGCLNPAAGDMTVRLDALYHWTTSRLLLASSRRSMTHVQEALDVLVPLQEAWRGANLGVRV